MISLNQTALAKEKTKEPVLIERFIITTGTYYSYESIHNGDQWLSILFVPNDGRNVSFSTTQMVTSNDTEQGEDDNIFIMSIAPTENREEKDYLEEGFAKLNEASIININTFNSDEDEDIIQTRDPVEADLKNAMRAIYGNEYSRVVYRNYTYPNTDYENIH